MGKIATADAPTDPPTEVSGHYTAVVYFHGMGSQRRFEETSRLIDGIDHYLYDRHQDGKSCGFLTKIKPQLEPARAKPDETVTFIRTFYQSAARAPSAEAKLVRFYEAYWAPVMAGQQSATGVLKWMARQIIRPWGTLRSPWRERQRLRRATLAALYEQASGAGATVEAGDCSTLARRYDEFEGPAALRRYPDGSFDQFVEYLRARSADRPVTAQRHETLARRWRTGYRRQELRNAFALVTLALTLALLAAASLGLLLVLLQRFTSIAADTALSALADAAPPTWKTAFTFAGTLASLLGLGRFLTDYLGGVEAWATYEETDEKNARRAKVIEIGTATLVQVLGDDRCRRVVIVAHSLGTSIAHDTLLAMARFNRARHAQDPIEGPIPLTKIEHFITLGSPIDKIEYFFESYRSPFHRYRRVVESLRGDIGSEPFSRNRKPFVHWINFWDDGDLISGPLHSPAGHEGFVQRVDNVHVASLGFPNPGASHSAYFFNRAVIERLFEVIYRRAWSFRTLPPRDKEGPDWDSAFLGPAIDPPGARRGWLALAVAIPWLALAALGIHLAMPNWGYWPWLPAAGALAVLALGFLTTGRPHQGPGPMGADTGASEAAMASADPPPVDDPVEPPGA